MFRSSRAIANEMLVGSSRQLDLAMFSSETSADGHILATKIAVCRIVVTPGATANLASTHNVGQDIVFVYR
jgi:hypothetical protein